MGRGDFELAKKDCWRCGRRHYNVQPLCSLCLDKEKRTTLRVGADGELKKTIHRRVVTPIMDERDRGLIRRMTRGTASPEFIYKRAWETRQGKCSRCHRIHHTLRVVPTKRGVYINALVCQECYVKQRLSRKAKVFEPKEMSIEEIIWRRADTVCRALLSANAEFMAALHASKP